MRKIISVLLILALAVSLFSIAAVSGAEAFLYGDADGDTKLTVLDATSIQKHLASLALIPKQNMPAAMVLDGKNLTILDATLIQKKLASLIDRFPVEAQPEETTSPTESVAATEQTQAASKTLVAVFSRTGNTRPLAAYAAEYLDADLFEIEAAVPYTDADIAYYTNCRADQEQRDPTARPEIAGRVDHMEQYDTVVIAYPIWHGQAPKIIYTFLESYDFSGKTIIPFCTSASSPLGTSASNLHAVAKDAVWKDGRRFAAGTSRETIDAWLQDMGY